MYLPDFLYLLCSLYFLYLLYGCQEVKVVRVVNALCSVRDYMSTRLNRTVVHDMALLERVITHAAWTQIDGSR